VGGPLACAGGNEIQQATLLRVIGGGYLARHIQNVDLRVTRMDQVAAWRRMRQHHLDHEILPLLVSPTMCCTLSPGPLSGLFILEARLSKKV
jgi:hypothetical protein